MRRIELGTAAMVALSFACGGTSAEAPPREDSTATTKPSEPSSPTTPPGPDASASPDASGAGGGAGATADAGASGSDGGGTIGDAAPSPDGPRCLPDSVREQESNDTEATANTMPPTSGSFCGELGAGDVDYVTVDFPADAVGIAFANTYTRAGLEMDVTANGKTFRVGDKPAFEPGHRYVVKVTTTGVTPSLYRLDFTVRR